MSNNNAAKTQFESIDVWERIDDTTLLRYRCLRVLSDGKFFVKCSDFYYYPISAEQLAQRELGYLDSLFQDGLKEASRETYVTLDEAIRAHEKAFGNR
jgi:hypothetical protein